MVLPNNDLRGQFIAELVMEEGFTGSTFTIPFEFFLALPEEALLYTGSRVILGNENSWGFGVSGKIPDLDVCINVDSPTLSQK